MKIERFQASDASWPFVPQQLARHNPWPIFATLPRRWKWCPLFHKHGFTARQVIVVTSKEDIATSGRLRLIPGPLRTLEMSLGYLPLWHKLANVAYFMLRAVSHAIKQYSSTNAPWHERCNEYRSPLPLTTMAISSILLLIKKNFHCIKRFWWENKSRYGWTYECASFTQRHVFIWCSSMWL